MRWLWASYWQAAVNTGRDPNVNNIAYRFNWHTDADGIPVLDKTILPEFLDANKTMRTSNTDWFNEISNRGLIQSYDIALSNGTEKGNYLFSVGYFDNKGVVKTTGFNRLSARMNSSYKLFNNKLTIGGKRYHKPHYGGNDPGVLPRRSGVADCAVHTVDGVGWGALWAA